MVRLLERRLDEIKFQHKKWLYSEFTSETLFLLKFYFSVPRCRKVLLCVLLICKFQPIQISWQFSLLPDIKEGRKRETIYYASLFGIFPFLIETWTWIVVFISICLEFYNRFEFSNLKIFRQEIPPQSQSQSQSQNHCQSQSPLLTNLTVHN